MNPPKIDPCLTALLLQPDHRPNRLPAELDLVWRHIIHEACEHRLGFLLRDRLRRCRIHLPPEVTAELERCVLVHSARYLTLKHQFITILRLLDASGFPCAPLRGFGLSVWLDDGELPRPMGDIDLLVPRHRLAQVRSQLTSLGYEEIDRRPGFAERFSHALEFFHPELVNVIIEPHWTIAYPPHLDRLDMDDVWARVTRQALFGIPTWVLARVDLAVHLCCHLIHRADDAPFLWWYELDRVLRASWTPSDWALLIALAKELDPEPLHTLLTGLRRVFQTPIPDEVLNALGRATPPRSSQAAQLQGCALPLSRLVIDGRESLARFFTIQGMQGKVSYLAALAFPSPQFMRLHYGCRSRQDLFRQYLVRLWFLCVQATRAGMGLFRQQRTGRRRQAPSPP